MAEPKREEVESWPGLTVLEFGASWCPICRTARPSIDSALAGEDVRHEKIEDGPGQRLGRSFRIKLWPTLVLLRDGAEVGRVVRPTSEAAVRELLAQADTSG